MTWTIAVVELSVLAAAWWLACQVAAWVGRSGRTNPLGLRTDSGRQNRRRKVVEGRRRVFLCRCLRRVA